jgi:GNAT superfamily N-acetyltransferase
MRIRRGVIEDVPAVLALGDEAVVWMNSRGNTSQWGTEPWTGNEKREASFRDRALGGGMRILETDDGDVAGVLVVSEEQPKNVPSVPDGERDLYVNFLITSRRRSGEGLGALLIDRARAEATERGIDLIRVDCWAGEDGSLVRVYERYGFTRVEPFLVGEWPGMLLAMRLSPDPLKVA